MRAKKLYKPNVVYIAEIYGCQYYVGCHCWEKEIPNWKILDASGNPLHVAHRKGLITHQEYRDCCKLVHVEKYDTKEEALNRESELIEKFKNHYGILCLNKSDGNMFGNKGVSLSEESRKKLSNALKGENNPMYGKHLSVEAKQKLSEIHLNHPKYSKKIQKFTKEDHFIKEYPSIGEASRESGVDRGSISKCCCGKLKSAGNYLWRYST